MKNKHFGIVLPIVLISYFMILLDNSVVFTSTVKISHDLNLNTQTLSWVSTAYVLTFGGLLLLGGRIGDLFGRKKVFLIGLLIFTIASLLVGLSVNATMIIAMRAIQGIGSSILAPTTLALLMDNYHGRMRERAIAYYGATAGLGASFGLLIGGLIASFSSWRVGFLMNVPIGIVVFILTIIFIKNKSEVQKPTLDILGTIFSVIGLSGIIYGINGERYKLLAFIVGIISLILFIFQERKAETPIMPLKLFSSRVRVGAYISRFFIIGMCYTFLYLTPQLLQNLYHYTPFMASILFLMMNIPQFIAATLVPRLNLKLSNAQIASLAAFISLIGLVWIYFVNVQNGFWISLAIPMILLGIGQGFVMSPLTSLGVAETSPDIAGSASGVVNVFHQSGQSMGLSIVTALTSGISSYVASYSSAILIILVYTVISLISSLSIIKFDKN